MLPVRCLTPLLLWAWCFSDVQGESGQLPAAQPPTFSSFTPLTLGPTGLLPAPGALPLSGGPPPAVSAPIISGATNTAAANSEVLRELRDENEREVSARIEHAFEIRFADRQDPLVAEAMPAYDVARASLERMLNGEEPLSLLRAVYAAERPIIGDRVDLKAFSSMVNTLAALMRNRLQQQHRDLHDADNIHLGIQQLFRDTFTDPLTGKRWRPLRYDLDDFFGDQDPAKITVAKLLLTGEGQCRSMPLLYLVLAEAMHVEAYLAFSPNHSYVKYRDTRGTFHNFETTNGHEASDAWIVGSGYVHIEAIRSRAYMDTVGTLRTVAHLLGELAVDFRYRFGFDPAFMEPCLGHALKVYPQDIHTVMELSNLRRATFERAAHSAGYPPEQQLATGYPALAKELREARRLYDKVDHMGYAEMPAEAYTRWQRSLDAERAKRTAEPPLPINSKDLRK